MTHSFPTRRSSDLTTIHHILIGLADSDGATYISGAVPDDRSIMTHSAPSARGAEFWQGSATKISLLVCPATHHCRIAEIARRPHPQVFALRRGAARFLAVLEPAGARPFRGVA